MVVSSAGMPAPLLSRLGVPTKEVEVAGGLPLGSPLPKRYTSTELRFEPGDVLLFSSDGLAELPDERGTELGYEGLAKWFTEAARDREASLEEIANSLNASVESRAAGAPPDDVTLVLLRYNGA